MEDGLVKPEIINPDFCSAELRNVKTSMSGRESYGDDAIGYVQLKRVKNICIVKGSICPEHKVRSKPYAVTIIVNEQEEIVISVQCHGCPASEGGYKHGVAFLMWLHRRTEEPFCTSVECYWRKSNLAKVGSSIKILMAKEISKKKPQIIILENNVMNEFVLQCKNFDTELTLSLHRLMIKYNDENCETFFTKISHVLKSKQLITDVKKKLETSIKVAYGMN
ncbi:unnamed protein product [Parnassius mnemosyne]|uniref:Uncharacterized protein n=1 Tax=Parnassius mnemosyne TaxID=213953 RepID=A0AAV1K7G9_9NEOP